MEKDYSKVPNTVAHLGDDYTQFLGAVVPPIFENTLFTRKEKSFGYSYTRVDNPTVKVTEQKIAQLEKGNHALLFASGMAAITASLMAMLSSGDHAVVVRSVYTPVKAFFDNTLSPRYNIGVTYVHGDDLNEFEAAIKPNTKIIYLESPSSNIFLVQDIAAISKLAHSKGIKVLIDNTWATPYFQNPLDLGADVVMHSASKYLGGHSDIIAGVIATKDPELSKFGWNERSTYGACVDPMKAWLLTRSLRSFPLRMEQHCKNGLKVAKFLEQHPMIERVYYPGLESDPGYELGKKQMHGYSGLMSFIAKAPKEKVLQALKSMQYFEEGPSWGGYESLFNFPGAGEPAQLAEIDIPSGLFRISVGLEDADSLCADLDNALNTLQ